MLALSLAVGGSNVANAQSTAEQVTGGLTTLQEALIAANVVVQNVTVQQLVEIGDITVTDVVDVKDVLNNAEIKLLNNVLNDLTIDNVLNNLLRDADILNNNQVVVGILSGALVVAKETKVK